jgi:ubiquinone/menaquinone biosynthesis C-methylase UbiE
MAIRKSTIIRSGILNDYYQNVYQKYLFDGGLQGKGITYFEKQVEKFWIKETPKNVLEIGGGNGEHLSFLTYSPTESYTSLDLRPMVTMQYLERIPSDFKTKIQFIIGDAEMLPFVDSRFDRVFTTCLLHHVDDVLSVLIETRRVTEVGGEIAFLFPTDPGILNQLVKKFFSFRKIKKITHTRPELFYALEHKNHVLSIMEQIRYVFQFDELEFHFRPFRLIRSWNFNLLVVAKIVKN